MITFPFNPGMEFYDSKGELIIFTAPILHRFLSDMMIDTNTNSSESQDSSALITSSSEFHQLSDANAQIEDVIPIGRYRDFYFDVKTGSYTAVNNDFIEGRSDATIKLDENANHNDQIITKNGDSSGITFDGGSIELRHAGRRSKKIVSTREGTSIHWYMFISGSEKYWSSS